MYVLLDANITAAYYLPRSMGSKKACDRIENLFDSARSGASKHFFYLPNFCVAEVFGVFMKYSFGKWNPHVSKRGSIDTRVYKSLVKQFQKDIHNGDFIYHYELSRYHVLGINLVAPIDHYFRVSRKRLPKGEKRAAGKKVNPNVTPMGTLDHLIISMGVHLARIHGREETVVVSADDRLTEVLRKCKSAIPAATLKRLCLDDVAKLTGAPFCPETFPKHLNLKTASIPELKRVFGDWPLPVKRFKKPYRENSRHQKGSGKRCRD